MPRKRRTKFSKKPMEGLKPYYIGMRRDTGKGWKKLFDLRNREQYLAWVDERKLRIRMVEKLLYGFFWKIIESHFPAFKGGMPYFIVPQFPLKFRDSPAHLIYGIAFIKFPSEKIVPDAEKRQAIVNVMVDHEKRELMLGRASYSGLASHRIAVAKEKRDLERKGLLEDFLGWLKTEYPKAYKDRVKRWKTKQ